MKRNMRSAIRKRTFPELRRVNMMRMQLHDSLPVSWLSPEALHRREFGYFQSDEQLEENERVYDFFTVRDIGFTASDLIAAHKSFSAAMLHIERACEDEELQPIECEKHGSCMNCPHYTKNGDKSGYEFDLDDLDDPIEKGPTVGMNISAIILVFLFYWMVTITHWYFTSGK